MLAAISARLQRPPLGLVLIEVVVRADQIGGPIDAATVLRAIEDRIGRETGPDDLVLPTGPDRLTVVRAGLTAPAEAEGLALRIQAGLAAPMLAGEGRVHCRAAIGVAVSRAGDSAADLLRYAEHALGDASLLGGDRVVAFDDRDRELLLPDPPLER